MSTVGGMRQRPDSAPSAVITPRPPVLQAPPCAADHCCYRLLQVARALQSLRGCHPPLEGSSSRG